jgi:hypothetical protein
MLTSLRTKQFGQTSSAKNPESQRPAFGVSVPHMERGASGLRRPADAGDMRTDLGVDEGDVVAAEVGIAEAAAGVQRIAVAVRDRAGPMVT